MVNPVVATKNPGLLEAVADSIAGRHVGLPRIGNATMPFLIDEIGDVRAAMKMLKKRDEFLSEALKARWPGLTAEGERYVVEKGINDRTAISAELARQVLDAATLDRITQTSPVTTMRFKLKEGA